MVRKYNLYQIDSFSKKVENVTIDLGFDIGFRTPNSDMKKLAEKYVKNEQLRAIIEQEAIVSLQNRLN